MTSSTNPTEEALWQDAAVTACRAGYAGQEIVVPFDYKAAGAALAAALPALRAQIETELRQQIADEIEAERDRRFAEYGNEDTGRNYDWALTHAARIALGKGGQS